ncbi:PAS domain-containing sensor histidine kinase [Lutibacter sp. B1]|uniref:sensor histidine kinase n=1 Tax=Lutibacter sp. B1 TaxID=2725996 RepID=UPI0014576B19|nr:ATP-binding protein [Lutibacter sp. B1]NLP56881.1 histidine kinase [Lutibacter sp. B1]
MASKNYYFQLILRIVLISILAFLFAFTWLKNHYYFAIASLILLIVQVVFLIKYLNKTNVKIAYFLDSLRNEDFTVRFPEKGNPKSLKQLHKSLNNVNNLIRETQIKNREQENYYQEILKQAKIGILTLNDKGHILYANPSAKKLFNCTQLNHIRQLEKVDEKLFYLLSELKPFERRLFKLTNERETVQLLLKSTEVVLNENNLKLITVQDINTELDEKETDSWKKLIKVLTHEIMNTITPITSISESILNFYKNEKGTLVVSQINENHIKNTVKGLEVIHNQGNDLMGFVQSYRSLLNIPHPDKKIINVKKLIEKVKILVSQEKGFNAVTFKITDISEKFEIFADEKQITLVLINLLKNAIQSLYEKENGVVEFDCGITKDKEKYIKIKDNGFGISNELIDEIFVPFFTTKTYGSGIGLSLSKQIMQLHGGSLKVHSIPFIKTSFTLVF